MEYISHSAEKTKEIAVEILKKAQKATRDNALVLALQGDLGAGKTNFVQGIGEYLGITRNLTSPTFVMLKRYMLEEVQVKNVEDIRVLYHLDCYRSHSVQEILDIGWDSIISEKENLVLVEWAEKIEEILPKDALWVNFEDVGNDIRKIVVN